MVFVLGFAQTRQRRFSKMQEVLLPSATDDSHNIATTLLFKHKGNLKAKTLRGNCLWASVQINNHFEVKQHCLKGKKRKGKNPRCSRPEVRDFSGWSTQSDDRAQGPYLPPPPPPPRYLPSEGGTLRLQLCKRGRLTPPPGKAARPQAGDKPTPPHTRPAPLSGQQTIVDVPSYRPAPPTCGKSPSPPPFPVTAWQGRRDKPSLTAISPLTARGQGQGQVPGRRRLAGPPSSPTVPCEHPPRLLPSPERGRRRTVPETGGPSPGTGDTSRHTAPLTLPIGAGRRRRPSRGTLGNVVLAPLRGRRGGGWVDYNSQDA